MAYKSVALRKRSTTRRFIIADTRVIRQRNGVTALRTNASTTQDGVASDVVIFANGRRAEALRGHMVPGALLSIEGKFSQHNTFVALGLAAAG